jgi:hypothetical protein
MPFLKDKTGLDHVVATASARARGAYQDLTASLVTASFATKVTGPLLLAGASIPVDGGEHLV